MRVTARRRNGFTHDVEIEGGHTMVIDEPESAGGANLGPSPTRTLGAALAACTAITCEMYAARKGWELGKVEVDVEATLDDKAAFVDATVTLRIPEKLDSEQQAKLLKIAGKCPVHRALAGETPVSIADTIESG